MQNKPKHKKKGGFHTLSVNEKQHGHQLGKGQKPQSKKIAAPELEKKKSISEIKIPEIEIVNGTKYIAATLKGKDDFGNPKINQDKYIYCENIFNLENCNIFGILDGHGSNGHLVSDFCGEAIKKFFKDESHFITKQNKTITKESLYQKLTQNNYSFLKKFYQNLQKELIDASFDTHFSGTTCVIIYQIDNKIICSNIGDSRAILINKKGEEKEIIELSKDQKPTNPEEKKRIEESGGEIAPCDDEIDLDGPKRVWVKGEKFPGIAISRTLGDEVGKTVGVICTPEFIEKNLTSDSSYCIVASDGIWEFLSNDDVLRHTCKFLSTKDHNGMIKNLVKASCLEWHNEGPGRDDISVVIHFFGNK